MRSSVERAVVYQTALDGTDIPVYLIGSRKVLRPERHL